MINIVTKELEFDKELKNELCLYVFFVILNGNVRKIDKINLFYIELHRIIIKGITFLFLITLNCW